jgi:hypothetical protein
MVLHGGSSNSVPCQFSMSFFFIVQVSGSCTRIGSNPFGKIPLPESRLSHLGIYKTTAVGNSMIFRKGQGKTVSSQLLVGFQEKFQWTCHGEDAGSA